MSDEDIVIATCRDEADLILEFIDFYLSLDFDRICLIDNGSIDGTYEKIKTHPCQDRIILAQDLRPGYDQRLLEYYQRFSAQASRWVFFVDIDEFVEVPGGIKELARHLPPDATVLRLPAVEMVPDLKLGGSVHPLLSGWRTSYFLPQYKVVWRKAEVTKISCGKHRVELEPYREYSDPKVLFVRHYHTRSPAQLQLKVRNRIQSYEAMSDETIAALSVFGPETIRAWMQRSRRLLEADAWEAEAARLEALPRVRDDRIRRWFLLGDPSRRYTTAWTGPELS